MKLTVIALEHNELSLVELYKLARERPVIVTRRGKPILEIRDATGGDLECLALANDPKFMKILEDSRRSIDRDGGIAFEEIRRELGLDETPKRVRRRRTAAVGKGHR